MRWRATRILCNERGTFSLVALMFFVCMGGLLSFLLLMGQADLQDMRTQQTADLITKGARAAGEWRYVDSHGDKRRVLIATTEEAREYGADIPRGAREEAELLFRWNAGALHHSMDFVSITHQKGERSSLFRQGIYHVSLTTSKLIRLFMGEPFVRTVRRVSQSGLYD